MLGRVTKAGLTVAVPMRQSVRYSGLYPTYHRHLVGPPRVRISFAEKAFWGGFFFFGILGVPAYILCNLDSYKGKK